ncbi:MAG TPA: hypothetical protein PLE99_00755 [Candidatus Thiothrix moscowensis]|uniref:hypothetical protein n=1 Tax=unclassified Thiothrix TaxID=2636184 RepID=UPI0025D9421F|nr:MULTISPECIES: hypothetical protein [unclassified Thiothrix]HRJ51265.1 hypothetical protein [Candidatus Thiothrix moscowensis]HRJ91680.1 hypothetical protein [Candidatus Thiothrix moscowensis]
MKTIQEIHTATDKIGRQSTAILSLAKTLNAAMIRLAEQPDDYEFNVGLCDLSELAEHLINVCSQHSNDVSQVNIDTYRLVAKQSIGGVE